MLGSIKNVDAFKNLVSAQQDQYEEDRINRQAQAMASAINGAINK